MRVKVNIHSNLANNICWKYCHTKSIAIAVSHRICSKSTNECWKKCLRTSFAEFECIQFCSYRCFMGFQFTIPIFISAAIQFLNSCILLAFGFDTHSQKKMNLYFGSQFVLLHERSGDTACFVTLSCSRKGLIFSSPIQLTETSKHTIINV